MNEDKKSSLLPASSAAAAASTTTTTRPPTDSLYPVQAPYGDLQGLTPPPEDFEELLRECHSLLPAHYGLVAEPPTPPRTESVSSPARSTQSGGSSPPKLDRCYPDTGPSSPGSDVAMDNEAEFDPDSNNFIRNEFYDSHVLRAMQPPAMDSSNDMEGLLEYAAEFNANDNPFFDFNSAGSSPKPVTCSLTIGRSLSQQAQQPISNQTFLQGAPPAPSARRSRPSQRKRQREDTDPNEFSAGMAAEDAESTVDVKMEYPLALQVGNPGFGNHHNGGFNFMGLPQNYGYPTPMFGAHHTESLQSPVAAFSNGTTVGQNRFPCELEVDFPKHPRSPFGGFEVKSRVETQIAVRFILTPPPEGINKIRLPRYAISKIKYIEDNLPQNNSEILELHTSIVCSSAMKAADQLERALCEARGAPSPDWVIKHQEELLELQRKRIEDAQGRPKEDGENGSSTSGSREGSVNGKDERKQKIDYSKPVFGAVVQICEQCMNRERKRAGRKKNKKPDEEEKWAQDEKKRIIVFNTNQVRQFDRLPGRPGSIFAETQMRICCYCRHHGEKEGFRVIFTLKNHAGAVVAQTISTTIVITDDHKNTAAVTASMMPHADGSISIPADPQATSSQQLAYPQAGFMSSQIQPAQEMIRNYSSQAGFGFPVGNSTGRRSISPPESMHTSLNSAGHQPKRRKSGKVPANLTMTPSDPQQFHRSQLESSGMSFAQRVQSGDSRHSWANPVSPMAQDENFFGNAGWGSNIDAGVNGFNGSSTSPITSHSAGTTSPPLFSRQQIPGPPPSALSAKFSSQQIHQFQQQMEQLHTLGSEPTQMSLPHVSRVVPSEGTCRGGIEITVLGRDFVQGLTVMFGDTAATDTSYFSDTTLLCRLPPNPNPGPVIVTLKNIEQSFQQRPVMPFFTYVDDVEKELMALALTVVGMKMKGEMGTSKQIALSILRDNGIGADVIESNRNNAGNQRADLEATLLILLDVIDMDESPHPATLGQRNKSGQSMLHLASMLGMQKFVAALLARGVNANCRDKNGYSPLHFAALYKRPDVVRRLLMNRANAGLRTRGGETAADLGESDQIVRATRTVSQLHSRQHSRSSSVSSETRFTRSRSGSVSSIVGLQVLAMTRVNADDLAITGDNKLDSSDLDYSDSGDERPVWPHSRKESVQELQTAMKSTLAEQAPKEKPTEKNTTVSKKAGVSNPVVSPPAAWMDAWREHLTQSFQSLQLNMPTIATTPLEYPTLLREQVVRLQHQVPAMPTMPWWGGFGQPRDGGADYKWSELLHPPPPPASTENSAPPAYDELYPDGNPSSAQLSEKIALMQNLPLEVTLSRARTLPASSSSNDTFEEIQLQIARRNKLTEAQQAEYRAKIKRIRNDQRLYFFWIPVLVLIILAMAYTDGPRAWETGTKIVGFVNHMLQEPVVVRDRMRRAVARAIGIPG